MIASATNRADGAVTNFEDGTNRIVLDGPADVRLGIPKADIVSTVQVGNDLVVTLVNGEQLVIENFFVADAAGAISQLIAEGGAVAFEGAGSGLVAAGLGALALGVVASSTGGSDAPAPTAAEIALEKINAYDGTDATDMPTLEDYAAAGVSGVTADNLEALNALVAASADDDLTAEELAALVGEANTQVALDLINAYDGTDATVAPTLEDYATAGVEGVTADTLEALNAAVAASDDDELTADEVEALLADVELAAALEVLNDYSGAGSVEPTAEDYAALGFDTLTPEQVAAVNALLPATADLTTLEEVQALIDGVTEGALATIIADATDGLDATDSAAETFGEAGVTGVTAENVDAINTYIAGLPEGSIDTTEELQAIVDAVNAAAEEAVMDALAEINAWDGTESLAEVGELLAAVGIDSTIVTQDLLAAEGLEVAAAEAILAAVAAAEGDLTVEELQALIDETIAELLIDNMPMSTAENTATALEAVGVTGVTEANQDEVLDAIAAAVNADPNLADSPEDLQAIVDTVVAGLADEAMDLINAYAVDQANPAPTIDDYIAAGVVVPEYLEGLSDEEAAAALEMLNEDVAATDGDLTVEDVQAMMDALAVEVATNVVSGYDADSELADVPTLADYEAMGVTGVTEDNIDQLNVLVQNAGSDETDEVIEIEALISSLDEAATEAQALIDAFRQDPENSPAPTVDDYILAGTEGVTEQTVDELNEMIAGLPSETVLSPELQQFLAWVIMPERMKGITFVDLKPGDNLELTVLEDNLYRLDINRDGQDPSPDQSILVGFNDDGTISFTDQDQNGDGVYDNGNYRGYNSDGLMSYQDLLVDGGNEEGNGWQRRVFEYNESGQVVREDEYFYLDGVLSGEPSRTFYYSDHDENNNWQYVERDDGANGTIDYIQRLDYDADGAITMIENNNVNTGIIVRDEFVLNSEKDRIEVDSYRYSGATEYLYSHKEATFDEYGRKITYKLEAFSEGAGGIADTAVDRVEYVANTYADFYARDRLDIRVTTETRLADGGYSPASGTDDYRVRYDDFDYVDSADEQYIQLQYIDVTSWNTDPTVPGEYGYDAATDMADSTLPMYAVDQLIVAVYEPAANAETTPSIYTVALTEDQASKAALDPDNAVNLLVTLGGSIDINLQLTDQVIEELVGTDSFVRINGANGDTVTNTGTLEVLADQTGVTVGYTAYDTDAGDVLYIDSDITVINVAV